MASKVTKRKGAKARKQPNTGRKQVTKAGKVTGRERTQFKPGQSGNPAGKPKGARHAVSGKMLRTFRERESEITETILELALKRKDIQAIKLIADRLLARAESQPIVDYDIGPCSSHEDIKRERERIIEAVARGALSDIQGERINRLLDKRAEDLETEYWRSQRVRDTELLENLTRGDEIAAALMRKYYDRLHKLRLVHAALLELGKPERFVFTQEDWKLAAKALRQARPGKHVSLRDDDEPVPGEETEVPSN